MKKLFIFPVLIFICVWIFFNFSNDSSFCADSKYALSVGIAKINVTPKTPIQMSGYGGRNDPFKGIHDELFARAVVLSDGKNKTVLITSELIGLSDSFRKELTDKIQKETSILPEYVLLSAVHTHGGPTTGVYGESNAPEVLAYIEELQNKLLQIVKEADGSLKPASIGAGKGICKMNINRRAEDGKGNVTLGMNPYGPCDHDVFVVRIDDENKSPIALIINWPCHGVVLGPRNYLITGDWPGATSRFVEKEMSNVIAPLTIGASGDINPIYGPHIDFIEENAYAYGMDAIGEDLGKEAIRVSKNIKTSSNVSINALQKIITLPMKKGDSRDTQPAELKKKENLEVRLSAVKIGNIVMTGVNGEVFNQISVKMRNRSPYTYTFMIAHCNGSVGYLVEDESIPFGGYEVRSTRAESGTEKGIIEGLLELINKL